MPDFPHLNLKKKLNGAYQFVGMAIDKKVNPTTDANLNDRNSHASKLTGAAGSVQQTHEQFLNARREAGLPEAFSEQLVPVFLQVDPQAFDIEALKGFGIEIVSEEDDGFIIGANTDNFRSLAKKIQDFIDEKGKSTASLWQIVQGDQWRSDYILSPGLQAIFPAGMTDNLDFTIDISVACYLKMPVKPDRIMPETDEEYALAKAGYEEKNKDNPERKIYRPKRVPDTDEAYEKKLDGWRQRMREAEIERDGMCMERQEWLTNFVINIYGGELLSGFVELDDSFGFRARMNGQALKDLIRGYPYIFEITESDVIHIEEPATDLGNNNVNLIPPSPGSPVICIIDSGLQERHVLLEPAVLPGSSRNYVPGETTTADGVRDGGHGTKVAGGILYGNSIPREGSYQPPCFLVNARILNANNELSDKLFPAELVERIADDFHEVRLFNMSVATAVPCRINHMSTWAAKLDSLIHERKLLFVLAAGNLSMNSGIPERPGVQEFLSDGQEYPKYLLQQFCRIANPAQSALSLTVGSVCIGDYEDADRKSFGTKGHISPFSRIGPGLWGGIKPDVVEYGGDLVRGKFDQHVTQHNQVAAEVVKTGANGLGYAIGTSFAAPKVMHIIAHLAKRFPNDSTLLYKTLVIQSARLPEHTFFKPNINALRAYGYGIPDLQRAVENTPYRVTFVAEGSVAAQQANLYTINIPEEIRRAGPDYDILIEVTLAYTAEPRRTRKRLKSYFGSWLSWESSRLGERFDDFSKRVLKEMEEEEFGDTGPEAAQDVTSIRWVISTSPRYGVVHGMKRQDGPTQKDWVILKSNVLTESLSFAVVGHKGWDKDTTQELPFAMAISFEAISKNIEIYRLIEVANQVEIEVEVAIPLEGL